MLLDPARIEDTRAWLIKAAADLAAAAHGLTASAPLLEDAVFHCQQAAEKSLKAFLAWNDVPTRKTHNLEALGRQCEELDPSPKTLIDRAVPLTAYAWKHRYPGAIDPPTRTEAVSALSTARSLHEAIAGRLPPAATP